MWTGLLLNALLTAGASSSTMVSLSVEESFDPNPIVANRSAAVGGGNTIAGCASLGIGFGNQQLNGYCTVLIGEFNLAETCYSGLTVGSYNRTNGFYNINAGADNSVWGSANFVMGSMNEINEDPLSGWSGCNGVFGQYNSTTNGVNCLIVGENNELKNPTADSAAIGHGLILDSGATSQIVVGQYNEHGTAIANARFVVANGTAANSPSNAFIVYANGDVRIPKRQGDIQMGEFGF